MGRGRCCRAGAALWGWGGLFSREQQCQGWLPHSVWLRVSPCRSCPKSHPISTLPKAPDLDVTFSQGRQCQHPEGCAGLIQSPPCTQPPMPLPILSGPFPKCPLSHLLLQGTCNIWDALVRSLFPARQSVHTGPVRISSAEPYEPFSVLLIEKKTTSFISSRHEPRITSGTRLLQDD